MITLNKYKIEHKILTLADCAVMENKDKPASFDIDGIEFSHWDFNFRDGWLKNDAWIVKIEIEASNYVDAINNLWKKLSKIVPRISLLSQSYIEYIFEPFFVYKIGSDVAFLRYTADTMGGGLMFMEKEQKALTELLGEKEIPETFYYYWNDAVNATGYSAKLLLMFSAIEALVKKNGQKDWNLINEILGVDLVKDLFGIKEQSNTGLRHRLVHGEYFDVGDHGKNYLELVHNKVISYFNTKILSEPLISENIVHPQRHFLENKEQGNFFLKYKDGDKSFNLKDLLNNFTDGRFRTDGNYEIVAGQQLNTTY
ncbi:MAG: hypothetical protein ABH881_04105 [bacterium]